MITTELFMYLFALVIAIPIHEYAHARSAVSYGDETPRLEGRLTIFPWDHFDPLGALMCVVTAIYGIGLGWGRPVNVNPAALRHPRWDGVKIAAWGPLSNLLLAIGFAIPLRFGWLDGNPGMDRLFLICVAVNLGLMLFNLIPIHPLDGSKVLAGFLPDEAAYRYGRFMVQYGPFLLLGLVFAGSRLGIFDVLISEPRRQLMRFLLGVQF